MSNVHRYIPGDNGCQARIREPSMWGGRSSTTTVWCGAPERSPYHLAETSEGWFHAAPGSSNEPETPQKSWDMGCGHFDSYGDPTHDCSTWSD